MSNDTAKTLPNTATPASPITDYLSRSIIGGTLFLILIFSVAFIGLSISCARPDDQLKFLKEQFSLILTVLGTWVGTILAFYFSEKNFLRSAEQTNRLINSMSLSDKRLSETTLGSIMISLQDPNMNQLSLTKPASEYPLKALLTDFFDKKNVNRMPISQDSKILYIVHRSTIDKFIVNSIVSTPSKDINVLTLADLISDPQAAHSIGIIFTFKTDTSVINAKHTIDLNRDCADVFITEDGSKNSKVIGWVTNIMIAELATV